MNRLHRWYCRTGHWRETIARDLLDWTLAGGALGDHLLELGAGPGTVTAHLRGKVERLTAIDVDATSLRELRGRRFTTGERPEGDGPTGGVPVQPVLADAGALPFAPQAFSSAAAFVMLHHLDGPARQRGMLDEVRRVLRPGGLFVGCDTVWTLGLWLFHLGDVFAPVSPDRMASALGAAGFVDVSVSTAGRYLRWRARPGEQASPRR